MKRLLSLAFASATVAASAANWTWDTDQTAPVTLSEETTITVPAGAIVTCSGVISGPGKLIKAGGGWLILSAANTYTGGTQIDGGRLQADNVQAFGPVNDELPIQVNSDCNGVTAADANVIAVVFNVATTFAYPINCAPWTNHGAKPAGSTSGGGVTLYNIAANVANVTLTGKITGGDVSFRAGDAHTWGNANGSSGFSVTGDVECPGGCVAINTRGGSMAISGTITAALVSHPTGSNWPSGLTLNSSQNAIGTYDVGRYASGGGLTCSAENAIPGCVLFSSLSKIANASHLILGGQNQTIDRLLATQPASASMSVPVVGTSADAGKHVVVSGTKPADDSPATLTMKATGNATNDWAFSKALSIVWDPQGDYTILNVSRQHIMTGTIAVKGGCFAMDENCTFSNVAKIVVSENASVSNMCAFAGSFNAVADVTLGANAALWVAENPFASTVTLDLAAGAKLHVPDGVQLTVTSVKYDGKYQKVGDHTTDAYMVGGGTVKVLTNPGAVEETVVWQGGTGAGFNTAANWVGKVDVPDFEEGLTTLRFAQQGTANLTATADVDAYVKGVEFGDVASFKVAGDGTHALMIGANGVTAEDRDAKLSAEIAAPVIPLVDQAWDFGSNVLFTMSGSLMANAQGTTPVVTITAEQGNPIWFVGSGLDEATSASTFAGTLSFKWKYVDGTTGATWPPQVFATGYEPFGVATTVSIWGAPQSAKALDDQKSCLWLSNTVISANLESPYDKAQSRYGWGFCSCANSTNVVNGTVYNVRDVIVQSGSKLVFNGDVTIPPAFSSGLTPEFRGASDSPLVFNGRLIYPGSADVPGGIVFQGNAVCYFNAPSNDLRKANSSALTHWHFGADYAFCDGKTDIGFSNTRADYDLHGHPQFVGSILDNSGAQDGQRTRALVKSTEAPTFIRINQTEDAVFYGTFDASITNLTLGGTAALTLKTANAIKGDIVLEGATLALDGGTISSDKNITFAGGTLSLSADAAVYKAYYVENDEVKPLPRGTYRKNDGSPIGGMLDGTGALHVRKSDIKTGLMLLFR